MNRSARVTVLVVLAVVATAVPAAALPGPTTPGDVTFATQNAVGEPGEGGLALARLQPDSVTRPPDSNNSTRHENPDAVSENGDLGNVGSWLERSLASQLSQGTVTISQGQYEFGRDLFGDEYDSQLSKYVDVAGRTGGSTDNTAAEQFEDAQSTQQDFADAVVRFRETYDDYQQAKANGNEARARELARELDRLSGEVNRTSTELNETFANLSETTDADLSRAAENVTALNRNVSNQSESVLSSEFVATRLSVTRASTDVSFLDPLQVTGTLTAENGSAIANEQVSFRVGNRTVRVRTDASGDFAFTYRPTTLALGRQIVAVRFVPANTSLYLGSNESVSVTVSQVESTVTLDGAPDVVRFDDRLAIEGRVSASDIGASGVPVAVYLGGERLGTARTGPDGEFTLQTRVPASVPNGTRQLRVEVAQEDRALASSTARRSLAVESTQTELSVSSTQVATDRVRLAGTLSTADGTAVANQQVVLRVNGSVLARVQTGARGGFLTTVTVPESFVPTDGNVSVTLAGKFTGEGTNLAPARAESQVELAPMGAGAPGNGGGSITSPIPWVPLGLSALAVLVGLGGFAVWRRRDTDDPAPDRSPERPDATPETPSVADPTLLSVAAEQFNDRAYDEAVQTAYAVVREDVSRLTDVPSAGTHWEFYAACESVGLAGDGLDALHTLTEAYERAAFAPDSVSEDDAAYVVSVAESFKETVETRFTE